jgi:hypothetical protein
MTTETAATSVKAGVLGMLRAVPGVKHAPSCWPKNWPDSCDQLEPYQSLGRLVSGLMLRAEVTPRLADCTGEPLCRRLVCLHCDLERAENALYRYRGGDFIVPACCVRPRRIKRFAMREARQLQVDRPWPAHGRRALRADRGEQDPRDQAGVVDVRAGRAGHRPGRRHEGLHPRPGQEEHGAGSCLGVMGPRYVPSPGVRCK